MSCIGCARGFHNECFLQPCCCGNSANEEIVEPVDAEKEYLDPTSTGRKRAARDYTINPKDPCEWRWQANCGGGLKPIIGCMGGFQEARHHGPNKDTMCNDVGNVHRICNSCHNTWHRSNDEIYSQKIYMTIPHDPRPATPEELLVRG